MLSNKNCTKFLKLTSDQNIMFCHVFYPLVKSLLNLTTKTNEMLVLKIVKTKDTAYFPDAETTVTVKHKSVLLYC